MLLKMPCTKLYLHDKDMKKKKLKTKEKQKKHKRKFPSLKKKKKKKEMNIKNIMYLPYALPRPLFPTPLHFYEK